MHTHSAANPARPRLIAALALSAAVFALEAVAASFANSLALLAEAFHVLIDVLALAIAVTAVWLAARPATERRTFGLLRLEILATVLNTGLLFLVASVVLVEGVRRLSEPSDVASWVVLVVATVGLASNAVSVALLKDAQRTSLTVRAAYLEVLSDLLGSSAVAGSAIVTLATGVRNADTVAAFAIVALILPRGWRLLREAIDVLLEATPRGVDLDALRTHIIGCNGVLDVHDLHVWTITSGLNVVSAHVVVGREADPGIVLDSLGACLSGDFDIEHSTFQLENEDRQRLERAGHP